MTYKTEERPDTGLDAFKIGNECRFINDPFGTDMKPNVYFQVCK